MQKILVFNYAPRLKVAGTFHILIEKDKRTLERLVDESDFVALEGNKLFKFRRHITRQGYDAEEDTVYTGFFDYFYLKRLLKLNEQNIRWVNEHKGRLAGAEIEKGKEFEQENEFDFCYGLAKERGKAVYMVDMPAHEILQKLIGLPLKVKLDYLWSLYLLSWFIDKIPEEVIDIIHNQREAYMLQSIIEREGPLLGLTRHGLLVTGFNHARNYQKAVEIGS